MAPGLGSSVEQDAGDAIWERSVAEKVDYQQREFALV
jgi:hypothetical protein